MNKAFKVEFLRNVSFFNIDHGGSWQRKRFIAKFSVFYSKFSCYPSAKKSLMKIGYEQSEIYCLLHQAHFHSRPYKQSQIGIFEQFFKGFGFLQQEMINWNVFQLMKWLDLYVEHNYAEIFLEMKKFSTMQKRLANFGPNGWRMFGMVIILML